MDRKALVIGSPGTPGQSGYLKGVEKDLENYSTSLQSPLGGAWKSSEIVTLRNPSRADVDTALQRLTTAEYSLAVFSGHGCHRVPPDSTFVELKPGTEMDSMHLRKGAARHTLILDCCRVVVTTLLAEAVVKIARAAPLLNAPRCRLAFDQEIQKCPNGLIVIHSCAQNETSGDDELRGGVYSSRLMDSATKWLNVSTTDTTRYYASLSVVEAHEKASISVQQASGGRQNPTIEKPRSMPYFPFAVIA